MTIMDEYCERTFRARMAADESELRRMLGLWVSELDPVAVYDKSGTLRGLSVAGHDGWESIYVTARQPWHPLIERARSA